MEGTDRFIPVRLEEDKLMFAFLEYLPTRVSVHDLVLTKADSNWEIQKSSYPKLRISGSDVIATLNAFRFEIEESEDKEGMVTILARKPASE